MFRPIIILTKPLKGGAVVSAYIGEDAEKAEAVFAQESQNPENESVFFYYYPSPRQVAHPAVSAQVNATSIEMQHHASRAKQHAEIKAAAKARLTREKMAEIEAQADAEAEASLAAGAAATAAVAAIAEKVSAGGEADAAATAGIEAVDTAVAAAGQPASPAAEPEEDDPSARFAAKPPAKKR